jgi:hypothetical protein
LSVLGKYVPGKVFHALGRIYLYRAERNDAAVTAAFAAEFVLGMTALATIGLVGLALAPIALPWEARAALWLGVVGGLVATFTGLPDRIVAELMARLLRRPGARAPAGRARASAFLLSFASHALIGMGLLALANAIAPTRVELLPAVVAAYSLAGIAGVLAFMVPAGLGVRDVALAALLSSVMSPGLAATVALAARCWLTVGELTAFGVALACARHARLDAAAGP